MSQSAKASASAKSTCSPKNFELTVPMGGLEFFKEAAPEQPREHPYREEEAWLARHPSVSIWRETAARYDAMHVRMVSQRRAPSVQHQGRADPGTQVLRIGGDRAQRLGSDVEQ